MIDKQHVIEVAISLYQERGYDNVTVNEICKQSGISYGTFFNHFETKDALLVDYVIDRLSNEQFLLAAIRKQSPLDKLIAMETSIIQNVTEIGAHLMTRFLALQVLDPNFGQKTKVLHDQVHALYCDLIAQAQEAHEIRNQSAPADLLGIMRDLCTSTFTAWAADPTIDCQCQHIKTIEILLDVLPEFRKYSNYE